MYKTARRLKDILMFNASMSAHATGLNVNGACAPALLIVIFVVSIIWIVIERFGATPFLLNNIIHKGMVDKETA